MLTESATSGRRDRLTGLKENVIIGRLIPARYDNTEEGRLKLGLDELEKMMELDLETPDNPPPPPQIDGEDISSLMDGNIDGGNGQSERPSEILPGE